MSPRCCVVTCLCSLSTTLHCFSNCPRAKWASCLKQSSSTNSEQRLVCHLAVKPVADTLSKRDLFSLFHTLIYPYFLNTIQKRSSQGTEQLTPLCASVVNVSLSRRRPPPPPATWLASVSVTTVTTRHSMLNGSQRGGGLGGGHRSVISIVVRFQVGAEVESAQTCGLHWAGLPECQLLAL